MNKTDKGLVAWAQPAPTNRWGYVWSTFGQLLTEELFQARKKQYPVEVGEKESTIRSKWMGKNVTDCVGLLKGYLWFNETTQKIEYDPDTDFNVGGMYAKATVKGAINTMPDHAGIVVLKKGHMGIYVGGKRVIEANSTSKGVINTPVEGTGSTDWTHWCEAPGVVYTYPKEPAKIEDEFEAALKKLVSNGIIVSPEMWRADSVKGKTIPGEHARTLILKMAKKLK